MLGSSYTQERLLALAGIASCASLIHEFATSGDANLDELEFYVSVFLDTSPENSGHALQPNPAFRRGLKLLSQLSKSPSEQEKHLLIYSLQTIQLMQQLMKRSDLLKLISDEIPQIAEHDNLDERLMAMGSLYERSASKLPFRIQIKGSQGYLRQASTAQKIRGILFCAIRYALLWQQHGGSKFDFVLRRANIRQLAGQTLPKTS